MYCTKYTYYAKVTSFGFNIPAGATITGILVGIRKCGHYCTANNYQTDAHLYAVKGGTIQTGGSDKADNTTHWTTDQDLWYNYGGSSDLWGLSWAPADINSAGFGMAFAAKMYTNDGNWGVASVDAINITIYYTSPPSGSPNTQTLLIINYRSNATSYFVRITTVALFANGSYQSCATFMNYESSGFNGTHWVGDYLIFNFTHTLAQHYGFIADALSNIVNNTYAPLAQQNETAYQLVIAYTALAQHARRLANFTAAYLQAYNKQITQATVLTTDPPCGLPIIPDPDAVLRLRGGGVIPIGGSSRVPISGSQGGSSQASPHYIWQTSFTTGSTTGLTDMELGSFLIGLCLVFFSGAASAFSYEFSSAVARFLFSPSFAGWLPKFVLWGDAYRSGQLGVFDVLVAVIGIIWAIIWAIFSDLRNWVIQLIAGAQLVGEAAVGPVFLVAVAVGVALLIIKLVYDCFT